MRIKKAGFICDGLWYLGTEESCVYLLEGTKSSAIISAGLSYILPEYLEQIDTWKINKKKIEHVIILHAHFDHVGLVPFLKRKWPHLKIYASRRGWEVLANPKAQAVFTAFTLKVLNRVRGNADVLSGLDWQWRDDVCGETLGQGSRLNLGDSTIEIYETPGHSSCSISAYVPHLRALFPSDAAAIPYRDEYVIAAGSSFEKFKKSLVSLEALKVDFLCADHYGYIKGEEAGHYISRSKSAMDQMIDMLLQALSEEACVENAAKRLVARHFEKRPDYFVAPEILLGTYTQMLKQFNAQKPPKGPPSI